MRFINAADEKVLHIGKQGENLSTAVDFSGFRNACLAAFGEGTLTLAHERAEDEGPYLIPLEGAVWNVTAADVQHPGTGLAELTYRVGDVVKKTMRWKTCTLSALGAQVEPPEAWQGYIDRVTALVDGIENMTVSAFPADEPTVTKSTDSEGRVHLSFGIVAGKDGHTPVKGEDYTDGKDGVGVASAARSGDSLVITLTDGTAYTIPNVRGATGPKGPKGDKGDSVTGPQGPQGDKGDPGRDGITPVKGVDYFDGQPGTGIAGIVREGDSLIIILTDGTRYTIPNLRGATGPQGPKGDKGDKGDSITGPQGPQGEPGKDADVTKEAIESALGYVPADEADAAFAAAGAYTEPVSTEEYSVDIPDGAEYTRVDMVGGHVEFIAGQKYIAAVESVVRHSENIFDKSKSIKTRLYPSSSDLSLKPATSGYSVAYKLEPNTTYSISKMPSSRSTFALAKDSFGGLAENAEIIGFRSNITEHTFTTDNNFTWLVWLVWNQNDDGTKLPYETILDSICLAKGDVVKYTPYYAEKHDIPESVRNIDGYGWSAGDAYNSIERTATGWQYVKRVERVMMESLYWRASDGFWMSSSINSITHKPNPDSYAHSLWQYGNIVPYNVISGMTSGSWASITSQGTLFVTESENSPVGEFYFELAVPEVIDITAEMGASLSPFALAKGDTITFDNVAEMYVPARVSYAKDITEALDTKADAADLRSTLTPVYTEAKGRYLNLDGRVYTASKYATCDFIAVVPGMTLHLEGFRADAQRAVCAYNRAQELVKVLAVGVPVGYVIDEILPDDAHFIRGCTDYDSTTGEVTGTISGYLYGNIAEIVVKHDAEIVTKQDTLVSGQTIKTINGESLLGSGNVVVQGGGAEKEWVLKGTITAAQTSVTVNLTGCTELIIRGRLVGDATGSLADNITTLAYGALANGDRAINVYYAEVLGYANGISARWGDYGAVALGSVLNMYDHSDKHISDITSVRITNSTHVLEGTDLKIYAR